MRKYLNLNEAQCLEVCDQDEKCVAGMTSPKNNTCWKYESFVTEFDGKMENDDNLNVFIKTKVLNK